MILNNLRTFVLISIFIFLSIEIRAQKEDLTHAYTPNTPEASRLIRDIQYPATYNYGMIDIKIPLFEIKEGEITLPIYLSYNHKGLKFSEYNFELGQGWTLDAVPAIFYNVNGAPDTKVPLQVPKYDSPPPTHQEKKLLFDGNRDEYPDSYFYKLTDRSGTFFLDPSDSNKPKFQEFDPI